MLELLYKRRSIRKFEKKDIEDSKVELLVKSALLSPSSRGLCPWEFVIVNDKQKISKLSHVKIHGASFIENAPLLFVVLGDAKTSDVWVEDTSIASIIIQLAAETCQLKSCWVQIRKRMHNESESCEEYVRNILKIPATKNIESIIAVGYPAEEKEAHSESDLQYEKVFLNSYKEAYQT